MDIKDIIKNRRLAKELTQEQLGEMIGTSKQNIQRYESGVIGNIPLEKLKQLAKVLDLSPILLMNLYGYTESTVTTEQALQALVLLERYAYQSRTRPRASLKEKEYDKLLEDVVDVINSKADQIYIERQQQ